MGRGYLYDSFEYDILEASESKNNNNVQPNNDLLLLNQWASKNCLTLNAAKSQAIIFGRNPDISLFPGVVIDSTIIPYSDKVRNLGLIMTSGLDWDDHITMVCQRMTNTLRLLKAKRLGTPRTIRILLVRTLVLSHLFYCDVIFSKMKHVLLNKVLRVFNGCIRYVYDLGRYDHISRYKSDILGMPLTDYLDLRVALLLFKILNSSAPPKYIINRMQFARSCRTKILILVPHSSKILSEALLIRGSNIWNSLPLDVREAESVNRFKKKYIEHNSTL